MIKKAQYKSQYPVIIPDEEEQAFSSSCYKSDFSNSGTKVNNSAENRMFTRNNMRGAHFRFGYNDQIVNYESETKCEFDKQEMPKPVEILDNRQQIMNRKYKMSNVIGI
jgi:hypothetical protein